MSALKESWIIRLFSGYLGGLASFPKGLGFIFKHKLVWYFIFPIILNILFWVLGFELVSQFSSYLLTNANDFLLGVDWGIDPDGWIFKILYGIVWLSLRILYFLLFAYLGGYLVLLFLSPILTLLSQKVEEISTGKSAPFSALRFLNDVMRSVIITIRNLVLELLLILCFLLLSLIPPLGLVMPIALFFVSAYYYGFALIDYSLERRDFGVPSSTSFVRKNAGTSMAMGTPLALILLIPFFGSFLAGFIAIISVVGATLKSIEILNQNSPEKY